MASSSRPKRTPIKAGQKARSRGPGMPPETQRAYERRMNYERLLAPQQEARCRGVVTRALKKLGLKNSDIPEVVRQDLAGIAGAYHHAYINR